MDELLIPIVRDIIIAVVIAVPCGAIHEWLHARKAMKLGYNVQVDFRSNETTIDVPNDSPDAKKIARAPYVVMFPLSFILLTIGLYFNQLGLIIGGGGIGFLHLISYPLEGRDIGEGSIIDVDE